MTENLAIGTLLQRVRKRRGLSQQELHDASGVSLSLIRKLEQQAVSDTRMETVRRLAAALRISTSSLIPQRSSEGESTADTWRPVQEAIEAPPQQIDEEPSAAGVIASVHEIRAAYFAKRILDLSTLLGPALRDADALDDADHEARSARSYLLQIAGSTLTQVRQFAAAETALQRALDDAPDRLRAASIITTWSWLLVRQGRFEESAALAIRWADDVEPRMSRATPDELAAWGWLLVQASAASLRNARTAEAHDTMQLARSAAVLTGRELPAGGTRLATWGPYTVAYKKAERGIVLHRPDDVLNTAERVAAANPVAGTEFDRHRLDVAKAHLMLHQYGEAFDALLDISQRAPEWLKEQRYAQDIMSDVIDGRRTLTPEMRSLATALRVPL
ncbi:helix-turn-helix domain-containing protein [Streptomyces zagrosensis]|uniref:Transcriptional regulator with XRE-family HTH domain n=1 Tax=Streptomyces zagrosensis TaxID=1042984 RepID=A0A7W9QFK9_9ACTN|nr:helix-turn-helix transcriptional regulator [Streptomyces zagrosensis]MBB5939371.1 transcriptional regulator with XRE-family HTH domain [Streptomyces zagrosensis]